MFSTRDSARSQEMKISLPWSLHSSWGKTDKDMVKYRACHMVISDMGTNDAGKRVEEWEKGSQ